MTKLILHNNIIMVFSEALIISLVLLASLAHAAPVAMSDGQESLDVDGETRHKREIFDMIGMLSDFGYLPRNDDGFKGQLMSNEMITEALRKFQSFNGLEVTGEADKETIRKMQTPRCGVPDMNSQLNGVRQDDVFGAQNDPQAYSTFDSRWRQDTIYWKPTNLTSKLSTGLQWTAFQRALDVWADVIPLRFEYSSSRPDMEIKFARGDHGDGYQNRFNGRGGVLAHAYGPGGGIGGDTHFDEEEDWTVNTGTGHDLTLVAAHEFGHALGLGHSSVPGALMAPYYMYTDDLSLHSDDIRGIQSIYGPRVSTTTEPTESTLETTSNPTTTTTTPTTTTTTQTTTTTTTTSIPTRRPWAPDFCQPRFRLDAITKGPDGFIYVFRERFVYKVGEKGLELHYPKLITDVFPGAPRNHIRAVTYVPTTGKTYIFKDARVWRFTDFDLDSGYPKVYSSDNYFKPSAAMTLSRKDGGSQVFLFGYDYFWEWSTQTERVVPGYPLSSRRYFPSAPVLPDAAYMNSQGNIFFFKHNRITTVDYRGAKPVSRPLSRGLFGPICGFDPETPELVTLEPPRSPRFPPPPPVPQAPVFKQDEAESMDSLHTESDNKGRQTASYYLDSPLLASLRQGKQPEEYYVESPLISSLLMNKNRDVIDRIEEVEFDDSSDDDDLTAWL